ncbi:hypothetical protein KBD61_06215 [Patescibacteria group bacterium]|nr:hypothetical protein [Candidatus Paceibacterota bacterium]MBP9710581.1 hypothetical protein [Patescibacteria group bacterium]
MLGKYASILMLAMTMVFGMGCGDSRDLSKYEKNKEKVDELMSMLRPPTSFIRGEASASASTTQWLKDNFDVEVPILKWNISLPETFYWDETDVFTTPLVATHEMNLRYSTSTQKTHAPLKKVRKRIYLYDASKEKWELITDTVFDEDTSEIQRNSTVWNMSYLTASLCQEHQTFEQKINELLELFNDSNQPTYEYRQSPQDQLDYGSNSSNKPFRF